LTRQSKTTKCNSNDQNPQVSKTSNENTEV
jgi:hypothetical protein